MSKDFMLTIQRRGADEEDSLPLYRIYGGLSFGNEPLNEMHIVETFEKGTFPGYEIKQIRVNSKGMGVDEAYELAACLQLAAQVTLQLLSGEPVDLNQLNFNYASQQIDPHTHD